MKLKLRDVVILIILFVTCTIIIFKGIDYTKSSVQTKTNQYRAFYNEDLSATTFDYNGRDADHPLVFQYTTIGDNSERVWPSGQVVYVTPNTKIYLRAGDFSLTGYTYTISNTNLFTMLESSKYDEDANGIVSSTANVGDTFSIKCKCFTEANARTIEFKVVWEEKLEYYNNGSLYKSKIQPTTSNTITWSIENAPAPPTGYTFGGWKDLNGNILSEGSKYNKTYNAHNQTTTLTAVWNPIEYEVVFDANDGSDKTIVEKFTYDVSKKLPKNTFIRKGYEFLGWSENSTATTATYSEEAIINNELFSGKKLYAVWEKLQEYTLLYENLDGVDSNNPSKYIKTDGEIKLNNPSVKSNYTFEGWYKDSNCTKKIETITYDIVKELGDSNNYNVNLYAKIEPILTIEYEDKKYELKYGNEIKLENPTQKEGYEFCGLYEDENYIKPINDNTITYEQAKKIAVNGRVKLYVKYKMEYKINYYYQNVKKDGYTLDETKTETKTAEIGEKITEYTGKAGEGFKLNEQKTIKELIISDKLSDNIMDIYYDRVTIKVNVNNIEIDVTYGDTINKEELVEPTKRGFEFNGWFIDTNDNGILDENSEMIFDFENTSITFSIDLLPNWKEITQYKINYLIDEDNMVKGEWTKEKSENFELYKPDITGYTFKGWFTDKTFAVEITSENVGEKIIELANKDNEISLYAKFELNNYKYVVEYYYEQLGNTGFSKAENETIEKMAEYGSIINDEKIEEFKKDVEGFDYFDATPQITISDKEEENIIRFRYIRKKINISINIPDFEESNISVKYGEVLEKPTEPSRLGYKFKGWYEGDEEYNFNQPVTKNINLDTRWELIEYEIKYDLNGGENHTDNLKTANVEDGDIILKNPTKKGYDFAGWYDENDNKVTIINVLSILKGETQKTRKSSVTLDKIKLYAKWNARQDTKYIITSIYEGLDGVDEKVENKQSGETDKKINVEKDIIIPQGFELDKEKSLLEATIKADGSTIFKIYFKRKKYTITFDTNGGSNVEVKVLKYGESLKNNFTVPTKQGYEFDCWSLNNKCYDINSKVDKDIKLTANWKAENVNYKVEYYKENFEGNYELIKEDINKAKSDEKISLTPAKMEGYEIDSENPESLLSGSVKPDGSLILKVFYKRKTYSVKYKDPKTGDLKQETAKYGDFIKLKYEEIPEIQGYTFAGWITQDKETFNENQPIKSDLQLSLNYLPNTDTPYTVNYYKITDGKEYRLIGSNVYYGTTDSIVEVEVKNLVGYKVNAKKSILEGKILADGSAVFNVYYEVDNPNIVETGDVIYIIIAIMILLFISNGILTTKRKGKRSKKI